MSRCVRALEEVHAADGYPFHWPADPAAWLTPRGLLGAWVAELEGEVVGHAVLCAVSDRTAAATWLAFGLAANELGEISRLFVSARRRGRGVGAALLHAVTAETRARGLLPVLDVLETNRDAIALYRRLGWQLVGSVPATWAETGAGHPLLLYFAGPG
jgi:GNAT superfamily N-acetyltransferase